MDTTDTPQPMTDADVSASDTATLADSTASTGGSAPDGDGKSGGGKPDGGDRPDRAKLDGATDSTFKQTLTHKTAELRGQAGDKVRQFAEDGRTRATGALDELAKLLTDAAGQVDDKLGGQFGQYARSTADHVQGFSTTLNDTSIDDMVEVARDFVRKSPVAAIGVATALGFVVARLAAAGLEQRDQA